MKTQIKQYADIGTVQLLTTSHEDRMKKRRFTMIKSALFG